ncbi:MAG: hypothetical protein A2W93_14565 [Bacteroidetes bacterium GWF2_43_63]|nr:MAG: hypothetical protein A2W93_14565 [Bacteroidetes bacterium GWF2_43_63]HBG71471.1 hypothetical protein [Bacteroidales bacterium]
MVSVSDYFPIVIGTATGQVYNPGLSQNSGWLRHSTVPVGDMEFFFAFEPEHGTVVTIAKTTVP